MDFNVRNVIKEEILQAVSSSSNFYYPSVVPIITTTSVILNSLSSVTGVLIGMKTLGLLRVIIDTYTTNSYLSFGADTKENAIFLIEALGLSYEVPSRVITVQKIKGKGINQYLYIGNESSETATGTHEYVKFLEQDNTESRRAILADNNYANSDGILVASLGRNKDTIVFRVPARMTLS